METKMMCQGCWEQMHVPIFIQGPFSIIFRPFGIKKSQMHPNICTICESMFTKVKKQKQIEIHTGKCNMGEVGNSYKDFTAIGHVVNLAARLQGAANLGEILMTEEVFKFIEDDFPNLPSKMLTLKNIDAPVKSYIIDRNAIVGYATPYTQIELKTK